MGLFDWFTNKAEKEIEKLNPLFFETWNELISGGWQIVTNKFQ